MKTKDFNYDLPENLVAQTPLLNREDSKMMIINKKSDIIKDDFFKSFIEYIETGDTVVFNDTKVLYARLIGIKEQTKATIELLLLKQLHSDNWECLVKPLKRIKIGTIIKFSNDLSCICTNILQDGIINVEFLYKGILLEIFEKLGKVPLPPYIHKELKEKSRYQTIYAKNIGSSAAPTAGLHFTNDIIKKLKDKKVNVVFVTLHVGLGTFRPVVVDDVSQHKMHSEYFEISSKTAQVLNETKANNKKIIAIGTTTLRVLETNYNNGFIKDSGFTSIFIYPGYKFKAIDGLLTNFHLPKSTLLMLVSALAGKDIIFKAYKRAVMLEYRFFSFGDCMLII